MFFVRSAFWLTLVFSAMPFERSEMARAIDQAKAGLPASAPTTERLAAVTNTSDGSLIAASRPAPPVASYGPVAAQESRDNAGRQSANSLTAGDRAPAWRGRASNSGA
jgi:hypothetical protein